MIFRMMVAGAAMLAGIFLTQTAAEAEPAYTTGSLNVRAGPGTGYARVGTLPPGTRVDLGRCQGNWCYVRVGGLRGWASASYLAAGAVQRPPVVIVPPPVVVRPPHYRPPHWNRPPHWQRPPHRPRPPKPRPPRPGENCRIAPGYPCPR
ncbi:SH3 domain-containing protein [Aquamicrobium sp. LC103]|uniref:SH3 domain-containing protein n=1 Tax=Aquamicrobium sp. LC103 TaxID=1120658 RepID=UPI00063EA698|nr:SH3 domain-containing protein [Aquamicrobium sp. LC103]TKT82691.1 SH3 domain-containing protein [Aquamicrobium sp. LC103]